MSGVSIAQEQAVNKIEWNVTAGLPVPEEPGKQAGVAGALSGVHNDVLIVAGGANFPNGMPWLGGKKVYHDEVYLLKKGADNKLKPIEKKYKLPFPTAYGSSCSTPAGVVYVGGENQEGLSNKVLLLKWDKQGKKLAIHYLPDLQLPLANASAASWGNKVFVVGGETTDSVRTALQMLDLDRPSEGWKRLPSLPRPVSHAVAVIQLSNERNCLYLLGGRKRTSGAVSELYNSTFKFDLQAEKWVEMAHLPYCLSAGTGAAIGDKRILLFGGDRGDTFNATEKLILAINKEKNEQRKEELNQQKIRLQANHPGFSKDVLEYNTSTDEWRTVGSIPFHAPVTTNAIKWDSSVIIPSGEIKAGVRTPNILVGEVSARTSL